MRRFPKEPNNHGGRANHDFSGEATSAWLEKPLNRFDLFGEKLGDGTVHGSQ